MTLENRIAALEATVQSLAAQIIGLSMDLQETQDELSALIESKADATAVNDVRLRVDRLAIDSAGSWLNRQ